ncbi:MAG: ClpX C4-type zinc finger protein [Caulobacteraceae bacterium]
MDPDLRCGFCGKRSDEVKRLLMGQRIEAQGGVIEAAGICNECVGLMMQILASRDREWFEAQVKEILGR